MTKRPDDPLQESGEDHPVVEDVDAPIEVTLEPAAAADAEEKKGEAPPEAAAPVEEDEEIKQIQNAENLLCKSELEIDHLITCLLTLTD